MSRTVSKTSLRGARRMRVQGVQGQGCPQDESTQPGPLTLLPHKTRVRHKKQAQVQTVSKTSLSQNVSKDDFPMALLPDPTTAALRKTNRVPLRKGFAGIYMSLPQCIEGCPQHESTHKTRVRHKHRHRSRTVSKTSLRGERG